MDKKDENKNQMNFNINFDTTPVLYTDTVQMTTNQDGVVLDVGQRFLNTNQIKVVTRIGMSREHAKKFLNELGKLLAMTEGQLQSNKEKN
jgi:hypothetical protein